MDVVEADSIKIFNVPDFSMTNNVVVEAQGLPFLDVEFQKETSSVNDCDMLEADIKKIELSDNQLPSIATTPIRILADTSYGDDFVTDKLIASGNVVVGGCDCDSLDETDETDDATDPNEKAFAVVMEGSECSTFHQGEIVFGARSSICKGNLPKTCEQQLQDKDYWWRQESDKKVEAAEDDVKDKWRIFVVVGVLVAALLSAIVTAVVVRLCCQGSSNVSPRY